jgi:hypothetical protein
MSRVISPATGRTYGLTRVARVWHLSRAMVYRHRAPAGAAAPASLVRRGPVGACSDTELLAVWGSAPNPRPDPRLAPAWRGL